MLVAHVQYPVPPCLVGVCAGDIRHVLPGLLFFENYFSNPGHTFCSEEPCGAFVRLLALLLDQSDEEPGTIMGCSYKSQAVILVPGRTHPNEISLLQGFVLVEVGTVSLYRRTS